MLRQQLRMNKNIIFVNRFSRVELLIPVAFAALIGYLFLIESKLSYPLLVALVIHLTWLKKIILHGETLVISYQFIPFVKKVFYLVDIQRITFKSNNAAGSPQVLIVRHCGGRKSRNYFHGGDEFQELINLLRDRGKDVEVISNLWD